MLAAGLLGVGYRMFNWFREVVRDGRRGYHTRIVVRGIKVSMAFFIASEAAFFGSFFWAFLHACWGRVRINLPWPPMGIQCLKPWGVPFYNRFLLIGSGLTVTYAHKAAKSNRLKWSNSNPELVGALGVTVILGVVFLRFQAYEYWWLRFSMNDGVYGSCFYVITGFHGLHVVAGTVWLFVCFQRARLGHFQLRYRHVGMQLAIWYWHFVDVVWILLFGVVYVNGSIWYCQGKLR